MDNQAISLRPTQPEDRGFCLHLFSLVKTEELQAWQWEEPIRATLMEMQFAAHEQHFRRGQDQISDSIILLAQNTASPTEGGQKIGRLIIFRGKELHLADISLLPVFRNQGFGGHLLGALQEEATREGLPLRLNCNPNNPALRLYLRQGFEVIEPGEAHSLLEWRPGQ